MPSDRDIKRLAALDCHECAAAAADADAEAASDDAVQFTTIQCTHTPIPGANHTSLTNAAGLGCVRVPSVVSSMFSAMVCIGTIIYGTV
jgi:hypothetical protein